MPPTTAAVNAFSPARKPIVVVDLVEHQTGHHAGDTGQRRADEERRRDRAVDVDAEHLGRLAVGGDGAHRLAELGAVDEQRQAEHQHDAEHDDHDPHDVDLQRHRCGSRSSNEMNVRRVVAARNAAEQQQHRVLEEERHAERGDQRRDPRRVAQRPVGEALDRDARARRQPTPGEQEHDQQQQRHGDRERRRAAEPLDHEVADERPDHVDVAVGEVQQLQDPVDHRVAERDQRVEAARW